MKVAIYARVSKAVEQDPENQLSALRGYVERCGYEKEGEYVDEISSKDTRPQKEIILKKLQLKEIDGVVFWSLDRWGRTLGELVFEIEQFSKTGQSLISMKEALDFSTSAGRLYAHILAAFANFERDRMQERTLLGLSNARAHGKIPGRHPVECGCGATRSDGSRHDGPIKPIRDEHNRFVGWDWAGKQTPTPQPPPPCDGKPSEQQPSV